MGGVTTEEDFRQEEGSGNVPIEDPQIAGNPFVDESKSNRTSDTEKR